MKATTIITILSALFATQISSSQISFDNVSTIYLDQMYLTPVTSEITITGYPNDTIGPTFNLLTTTVSIELSHVEAMEVWLECPNGSRAALINLHEGSPWEALPGGYPTSSWSGTFLGDPTLEDLVGTPGQGWYYTFSSSVNTWGDMETELVNGNFIPATQFGNGGNSMNPNGIYLPYWTFDSLVGCPVDGVWTLNIQDNIDFHNGTLFGWGLTMNNTLTAPAETIIEKSIQAYPNPVQSSLHITAPSELLHNEYVLVNELGKVLIKGNMSFPEINLDVSKLEAGVYFIRIKGSEKSIRVVKI